MEQQANARRSVEDYLAGQLEIDTDGIDHVEMIAHEWVGPDRYEVWDCHITDGDRWWVITPFTNLYLQEDFRSVDYLITFHVGLTTRMMSTRERPEIRPGLEGLASVFTEFEVAERQAEQAIETSEVQGAGVALRETLVSFAHFLADRFAEESDGEDLKRSDFKGWASLSAHVLAPGSSRKNLRNYLKTVSDSGWQYASWLVHSRSATKFDALVGASITSHILEMYCRELFGEEQRVVTECPSCGSRRVGADFEFHETTFESWSVCEVCDWTSDRQTNEYRKRPVEPTEELEGDCVLSSDGPGKYPKETRPPH